MSDRLPTDEKRKRFAKEFLKDLNGTQAAVRAGYSVRSAGQQASALLKDPKVQALLAEGIKRRSERTEITADSILSSLQEVADRCLQRVPVMIFDRDRKEYVQKTEIDPETGEQRGVWEFDASGANKALELLGKHLALFTDKLQVSGAATITIVTDAPPREFDK